MKIKDYNGSLDNIIVKTPLGVIGYWRSQWSSGVWLSNGKDTKIYPQFVNNLTDCLEWEIVDDPKMINCDTLTDLEYIDNKKEL